MYRNIIRCLYCWVRALEMKARLRDPAVVSGKAVLYGNAALNPCLCGPNAVVASDENKKRGK